MAELNGEGSEAGDALRRVQEFDPNSLVREAELGKKFALTGAVEPAQRVIDLFRLIRPSQIQYFPTDQQNIIRDQANAFYNLLERTSQFDVEGASPSPSEARENIIVSIEAQFQPIFNALYPLIAFASIRSLDFAELEREARAASQGAKDAVQGVLIELNTQKVAADTLIGEMRALAAEQGVSKQAIHFKNEADSHQNLAKEWWKYSAISAGVLIVYSVLSLFIHNIPGLTTENAYRAAQVAVSKVLIFGVLAYILSVCAKNFLSHKHNEIVNRHRQNALATYSALAEAASDKTGSDIVLSHAAACIFSPQETGYTSNSSTNSEVVPSLQLLPRVGGSMS